MGRFLQADTIVPEPGNPQSLNRFSYVRNSPLRYTDPSGHCEVLCIIGLVGLAIALLVVPGDSGPYDVPPENGGVFVLGMAAAVPAIVSRAVAAACVGSPAQCARTAEQVAKTACGGDCSDEAQASANIGQRTIDFMSNQLNRVKHVMDSKHAWDRLVNLSGDLAKDYEAVQPYIQEAINNGASSQINTTAQGNAVMQYIITINGQEIWVQAVQLANGVIQVTDAWIKTQ